MALQDLNIMPSSRLGCPLSLKTPNMGNTGWSATEPIPAVSLIQEAGTQEPALNGRVLSTGVDGSLPTQKPVFQSPPKSALQSTRIE